jgi:hypothetical protein
LTDALNHGGSWLATFGGTSEPRHSPILVVSDHNAHDHATAMVITAPVNNAMMILQRQRMPPVYPPLRHTEPIQGGSP